VRLPPRPADGRVRRRDGGLARGVVVAHGPDREHETRRGQRPLARGAGPRPRPATKRAVPRGPEGECEDGAAASARLRPRDVKRTEQRAAAAAAQRPLRGARRDVSRLGRVRRRRPAAVAVDGAVVVLALGGVR
jgi:hypothetical protein